MTGNKFENTFLDDFVGAFRRYNSSSYTITISGLMQFSIKSKARVDALISSIKDFDIAIELLDGKDHVSSLDIVCSDNNDDFSFNTAYQISDLPSLFLESSKTDIPLVCLLIMKCVAKVICKLKILYKAIALDLDDTLWRGTLSEDGIEQIERNLRSFEGTPFVDFMRFVKVLAEELGVFIAICSRNSIDEVTAAIEHLDESLFPLKNQIDCIVANNNDKSDNLVLIAEKLSILPGAIVFIDDNKIVRDEVKQHLPDLFVPEWDSHLDLISTLLSSCCFERDELSYKSQQRRKQYRVILSERSKNTRPLLPIRVNEDAHHNHAIELYLKSNQFNFSQQNRGFIEGARSFYFELYRDTVESLGVCSAITFVNTHDSLRILNWAMSCRFFEIGVEEFILLFIKSEAGTRRVFIEYKDSGLNQKVSELLNHYPDIFVITQDHSKLEIVFTPQVVEILHEQTNLRDV